MEKQKRGNRLEELNRNQRKVRIRGNGHGPADWSRVDTECLVDTLGTVAACGGALRLGYTRDGGAYAIGVYGDGDPYTLYIRPSDDIDEALRDIRAGFNAADMGLDKSGT